MGLLDDAIREHLDLKRRRGADPSEIAREESEALGPVRRGEPALDAAGVAEVDESFDRPYADESVGGGDVALDDDFAYDAPYDDASAAAPVEDEHPVPAEAPQTHPDPYAEREDESSTPPHGDPLAHQQTREFSADELDEALGQYAEPPAERASAPEPPRAPEPEPAAPRAAEPTPPAADDPDADELEDTPDFLQETPEHDRLWFEQKPPKDFDF
jgi:hypothetical protein